MKKNKHKSKNKTNTTTTNDNKVENNNRKTIPGYRLLSIVGGAMAALAGGYLWKQSGNINTKASVNTNTDPCAKYKIGDNHGGLISNEIKKSCTIGHEVCRTGCTYQYKVINDDFFTHYDTVLIDLNFDTDPITDKRPYNYQGIESYRYHQCSNDAPQNYRLSKADVDKSIVTPELGKVDGKNEYFEMSTLSDTDKKRIIDKYNNDINNTIECIKNNPSVTTIAVKYVNHRTPNGHFQLNIFPSDFKGRFAEIMKLNKNIYISEFSCFYSDDFPAMISELLRENPSYQGSIVLRRNRLYNQGLQKFLESGQIPIDSSGGRGFSFNDIVVNPEYLVFNSKEKKCITENEARKILGGSYLYNLDYNKMNKLGDKEPTQQCKASLDKYQQCDNKFNTYQTCDPLLDDVILNKEKLNQLSHGDHFLSDVE